MRPSHTFLRGGPLHFSRRAAKWPPGLLPAPQVVLGTDMKQHFSTVQDFNEKLAASGLVSGTTTGLTTKAPDEAPLVPDARRSSTEQLVSAPGSSKRRPPGRTNSMLDLKDALHAAAAPAIRTVSAGEESEESGAATSTLSASNFPPLLFCRRKPVAARLGRCRYRPARCCCCKLGRCDCRPHRCC